jgi:hypothetical protein
MSQQVWHDKDPSLCHSRCGIIFLPVSLQVWHDKYSSLLKAPTGLGVILQPFTGNGNVDPNEQNNSPAGHETIRLRVFTCSCQRSTPCSRYPPPAFWCLPRFHWSVKQCYNYTFLIKLSRKQISAVKPTNTAQICRQTCGTGHFIIDMLINCSHVFIIISAEILAGIWFWHY